MSTIISVKNADGNKVNITAKEGLRITWNDTTAPKIYVDGEELDLTNLNYIENVPEKSVVQRVLDWFRLNT